MYEYKNLHPFPPLPYFSSITHSYVTPFAFISPTFIVEAARPTIHKDGSASMENSVFTSA
jgi:hypothetical protein